MPVFPSSRWRVTRVAPSELARGMLFGKQAVVREPRGVPIFRVAEPLPFRRVLLGFNDPDKIPNSMPSTSHTPSATPATKAAALRAAQLCVDNKARDVVML